MYEVEVQDLKVSVEIEAVQKNAEESSRDVETAMVAVQHDRNCDCSTCCADRLTRMARVRAEGRVRRQRLVTSLQTLPDDQLELLRAELLAHHVAKHPGRNVPVRLSSSSQWSRAVANCGDARHADSDWLWRFTSDSALEAALGMCSWSAK